MRGGDYAELEAFMAAAEARSFTRAALRLGLSRSALSHAIRSLEGRVGTRLFNRTTRSVSLTEAGRTLFQRLPPAFAEIAAAVDDLSSFGNGPTGTIRLNAPRLAAEILLPTLQAFMSENPAARLDLTIDDTLRDIVAAGFDAGIRPGELVQMDMVAVRVTPDIRLAIVGAPAYFATHPKPDKPRDLAQHACIAYRWSETGAAHKWPFERDGKAVEVAVAGPMTINDTGLMLSAALDGIGLVCTLEERVAEHVAQGRLVRVLGDWCPMSPGFFLYYPNRRHTPPALAALIKQLRLKLPRGAVPQ